MDYKVINKIFLDAKESWRIDRKKQLEVGGFYLFDSVYGIGSDVVSPKRALERLVAKDNAIVLEPKEKKINGASTTNNWVNMNISNSFKFNNDLEASIGGNKSMEIKVTADKDDSLLVVMHNPVIKSFEALPDHESLSKACFAAWNNQPYRIVTHCLYASEFYMIYKKKKGSSFTIKLTASDPITSQIGKGSLSSVISFGNELTTDEYFKVDAGGEPQYTGLYSHSNFTFEEGFLFVKKEKDVEKVSDYKKVKDHDLVTGRGYAASVDTEM